MSVSLQGEADILRAIEAKLGKNRTTRIVNKALRNAGERNKKIVFKLIKFKSKYRINVYCVVLNLFFPVISR